MYITCFGLVHVFLFLWSVNACRPWMNLYITCWDNKDHPSVCPVQNVFPLQPWKAMTSTAHMQWQFTAWTDCFSSVFMPASGVIFTACRVRVYSMTAWCSICCFVSWIFLIFNSYISCFSGVIQSPVMWGNRFISVLNKPSVYTACVVICAFVHINTTWSLFTSHRLFTSFFSRFMCVTAETVSSELCQKGRQHTQRHVMSECLQLVDFGSRNYTYWSVILFWC